MKQGDTSAKKIYKVLIVDDDRSVLHSIGFPLRQHYVFEIVGTEEEMWEKLKKDSAFDLLLLDLVLDSSEPKKLTGLELLPPLQERYPELPVIVVTNDKQLQTGVTAMKRGAKDFLTKDDDYDSTLWDEKFRSVIEANRNAQKVKVLTNENKILREKTEYVQDPDHPFIGESLKIKSILKTLKTLADEPDLAVMILGETGVGKGIAARFLHYNSIIRRNKPFEEIHISTIPKELLEGTLFGTKRGTFTGSIADQMGRLEMADQGTVFLDEIGELSLENQLKLLQFLQNKTIRPTGSNKDIVLDVQIVSATNKVIADEVEAGNFRQDLYYRLKGYPIEIPPLRERREDIELLLRHFLKMTQAEINTLFDPFVKKLLVEKYNWPGNVRELDHVIRQMKARQKVLELEKITIDCLPEEILTPPKPKMTPENEFKAQKNTAIAEHSGELSLSEQLAWDELTAIENALREANGKKEDAALKLGFKSSDNIYTRIKKYQSKHSHLVLQFPLIGRYFKTLVR